MLEAKNVSFAYRQQQAILQNISLQVSPDERVALQAPSGRGKTTLCQLLAGYLKPTHGQILLVGEPLPASGPCPAQMIWQHPERVLDPRKRLRFCLEEAGYADAGRTEASCINERIIEELGIRHEWMNRFPHELSGGELQRFCIARALAAQPRYLIADEISTMLDAVTQAQIWHFLLQETERQHIGLVLVSHSPELTARLATRIVRL